MLYADTRAIANLSTAICYCQSDRKHSSTERALVWFILGRLR
ncbi:hypothetical protein [Trichocoleus sp. FACHB-90]|nr:hypothetical protein [Trichocoleus sp. FACHB-90]